MSLDGCLVGKLGREYGKSERLRSQGGRSVSSYRTSLLYVSQFCEDLRCVVCGVCYTIRILSMSSRGAAPDLGELEISANREIKSRTLFLRTSNRLPFAVLQTIRLPQHGCCPKHFPARNRLDVILIPNPMRHLDIRISKQLRGRRLTRINRDTALPVMYRRDTQWKCAYAPWIGRSMIPSFGAPEPISSDN